MTNRIIQIHTGPCLFLCSFQYFSQQLIFFAMKHFLLQQNKNISLKFIHSQTAHSLALTLQYFRTNAKWMEMNKFLFSILLEWSKTQYWFGCFPLLQTWSGSLSWSECLESVSQKKLTIKIERKSRTVQNSKDNLSKDFFCETYPWTVFPILWIKIIF